MRIALLMLVLTTGTALAGPAAVDGWAGPFESPADATAADKEPATEVWNQTLPAGFPIDELRAIKRVPFEEKPGSYETGPWHLAAHTSQGWFLSPQLGIDQNRSTCEVTDATPVENQPDPRAPRRLGIVYSCMVGRFDWAEKNFALLCGLDATGRPGCGRVLISANNNVHRGGKESGADTVYDTLSCAPSFRVDAIALSPTPPDDSLEGATFRHKLGACPAVTRFDLSAPRYPIGGRAPLFDMTGRWVR